MAITAVSPIWERRRSQFRVNVFTHYLMWLVTCDNGTDGPAIAIIADGIPTPGTAFVNADGSVAYLTGLDVDPRSGSDRHFEVQAEFTTLDPSAPNDNPLDQPPGYSWTYQDIQQPYFQDQTPTDQGGPLIVANSAGDAFEQLPVQDKGWLTITLTRNEATHDAAAADAYSNTVNQLDTILDSTTYTAGVLKLSPIQATKAQKTLRTGAIVNYYAMSYVFKARHEGWDDMPLDVGYNELVPMPSGSTVVAGGPTHTIRPIVDSTGMTIRKPWPLNGSGMKMPNPTDTPATLDFKPYLPMDWTPLNIL